MKLVALLPRLPFDQGTEPYAGISTGRWSAAEHDRFLHGLAKYPTGPWRKIADIVGTRTLRQTRTHADKYFKKLRRLERQQQQQPLQPDFGGPLQWAMPTYQPIVSAVDQPALDPDQDSDLINLLLTFNSDHHVFFQSNSI